MKCHSCGKDHGHPQIDADLFDKCRAQNLRDQLTAQQRETLRAAQEAERYRAALEEIARTGHPHDVDAWEDPDYCPACIARRALGGEGE